MKIMPIIMAGGSGTRLWPLSRELFPKQFIAPQDTLSLFQKTLLRLEGLPVKDPLIICNEDHRFIAAEQLRQIKLLNGNIILEPASKNTAPTIALAALAAILKGDDPVLLALASDHSIDNLNGFQAAIKSGLIHANNEKLVIFGIKATKPETGYGYIQKGKSIGHEGFTVTHFSEKPDLKTAERYISCENYFWNSGIFMFKASCYLNELAMHHPEILEKCRSAMKNTTKDLDFFRIDKDAFLQCPNISIDKAIMEKTQNAAMVEMIADWHDIGSWSALWDIEKKDPDLNVIHGDAILEDVKNSYIHSENVLIGAIGVEDIVIVQTRDAILVSHKERTQDVQKIVTKLKNNQRSEYHHNKEIHRPWGKYDLLDNGNQHKVKRITVKPGAKLSLQRHNYRAEHWIVISGTAKVTNDNKTFFIYENQSTYIDIGSIHSLENPGDINLEIIEVQSGKNLSEEDIVRFEDNYGRKSES